MRKVLILKLINLLDSSMFIRDKKKIIQNLIFIKTALKYELDRNQLRNRFTKNGI